MSSLSSAPSVVNFKFALKPRRHFRKVAGPSTEAKALVEAEECHASMSQEATLDATRCFSHCDGEASEPQTLL